MLVFDIESDGLLDTITKVQCINLLDTESGREYRFTDHVHYRDPRTSEVTDEAAPRDGTVADALAMLRVAARIGGHNVIPYDIPALQLVYPGWAPEGDVRDTLTMARVMYPSLRETDLLRLRKGKLPAQFQKKNLVGKHSLEAWGIRIGGELKADFNPKTYGQTWATMPFCKDMDDYCAQDVRTNANIFAHFESKGWAELCFEIEHEVSRLIAWQERTGVPFDVPAAEKLTALLQGRRVELEESARKVFAPFYVRAPGGAFIPKRDNKKQGYMAGAKATKLKLVDFNPGSRDHIANRLIHAHGWEPADFTPTGKPKVDETILGELPFPEAKVIGEFMLVSKRLSQLAEGDQAWLKAVKKDGRIYGRVNPMGCVTGRMAHFGPNLAQVPKNDSPYGRECRSLFLAEAVRVLVGCDADALELRMLAHFMARFDDGAYVEVVLNGRKEDGTDIHSRNQTAIGLLRRDTAKTWFYAFIYGAGNLKLGSIIAAEWDDEKRTRFYHRYAPGKPRDGALVRLGRKSRDKFMASLPALKQLTDKVKAAAQKGWLRGLDGRQIPVRSQHAALNTLLQSGGAVVMKAALVLMFREFDKRQLDVRPLLNIHDEVQLSATKEAADEVGRIAASAIRQAGELLNLRCPLGGNSDVGANWSETH